ncbi:histidinol-phosphate aminotransferase [Abditibacteriota bacterium]|nr:histidinol-phosphate aminotransferase [Abditibacteriota bacterium]
MNTATLLQDDDIVQGDFETAGDANDLGASCSADAILVRDAVRHLQPYVPGKPIEEVKRELGLADDFSLFKLASNENVLGPSPRAVEAMQSAAQDVWLYPDDTCFALKNALAAHFELKPENFVVGNGSDEVIHFLALAYLDATRGDDVVYGAPSFVQYKACAMMVGCDHRAVPLTSDLRHDLPAMARAVTENTRLVFIANPNNPTGSVVSRAEFEAFLRAMPPHVVVVLDEAYKEYATQDSPNALDYIHTHNVIALHTFSKAYGLAGTRVGYGVARPEIIAQLQQVRGPFNVNALAQAAAVAALGDQDHIEHSIEVNAQGREFLERAFERMGLDYIPSQANFVFVKIGVDSAKVFNDLLKEGVIIRTGTPFGMPEWIRVTIGTQEMNERFLKALSVVLNK